MNVKTIRLVVLLALTVLSAAAQLSAQSKVSGRVVDESGEAIVGVSVIVVGKANAGAVTDLAGNYAIDAVRPNSTLLFSYLGKDDAEVAVEGRIVIDVVMKSSKYAIEEIQIVQIGYGAVKKRDLTGSVASVKGEELSSFSTGSIAQSLQGRLSGVEVRTTSSEPGSTLQIRIRGTNSIKGGNDPLWIIDGFPGNANMLNTSDIESVEVLKDASATAIYGSRGSNGVIIVTTKQGQAGSTQVEYTGSSSVAVIDHKLDLLSAQEYMLYENILNNKQYFSEKEIEEASGTDWQERIFRPAVTNDHSVSVKAGTKNTRISTGASIYDQDGIIRNSSYTKASLRVGINHDISKQLNIAASVIYTRTLQYKQNGILSQVLMATPTLTPYADDGSYTSLRDYYSFSPSGLKNPESLVNEKEYKWSSNRTMANAAIQWKPFAGFTWRTAFNAALSDARQDNYVSTKMPESIGEIEISTSGSTHITAESTATYNFKRGAHNFSLMGGLTYEQSVGEGVSVSGTGLTSDLAGTYGIASCENIGTPTASYSKWVMLSFLGRVNYSFRDRYLATLNFRADGSSRYSKGEKWGKFPSMALAWRVSEEEFLKSVDAVNNLKIRAGYGRTGNTAINPYATLDLLTPMKTVFGKTTYTTYHPSSYYNFGLQWETTDQYNAGFDLGLWNNRLRLTADFYYKNTYNLLNTVDLSGSSGYISGTKNIGTMMNKGFELQLDARVVDRQTLKWDLSGNISVNRNKVVELPAHTDVNGTKRSITIINDYMNLLREGEPIGIFYGYVEDGYDDKGKICYVDYNNDGKINEYDKQIIGDPNPDFTFGLSSALSYKGFTLSLYMQGSVGNDIYSLSMASLCYNYAGSRGINTLSQVYYNHWTPETPDAAFPALTAGATASLKMSDRYVYDGSYLRIKNIELSYDIPMQRLGFVKRAVAYVSAQNLFTLTSYPFYNPDVNTYGGSSSVDQGIDYYSYPSTKSLTVGLRLSF